MAWDARSRSHHPGSPVLGSRLASSAGGSHSFLRRLTSFTRSSHPQPLPQRPRHSPTASQASLSPPSSSPSPDRMALAAAQKASLHASPMSTPPNKKPTRPASHGRRAKPPVPSSASAPATVPVAGPATTPAPVTAPAPPISVPVSTHHVPLAIHVEIRFPGLDGPSSAPAYAQEYASSSDLVFTDRLGNGLLHRLAHCSTELITRKDSDALHRQAHKTSRNRPASAKPLRYAIHFRVFRNGAAGVWAERTFSSYQQQDITGHDAREIILATHRMVGLFLRRHDPSFRWTDMPATDALATPAFAPRPEEPELVRHIVDHTLPLSCVPQSRFLDDAQSFEFVPGYAINLSFRSRCQGRKQYEWKRAISLPSNQTAPLNLALAEDLLWQAFRAVDTALAARRDVFREQHKACDFLEGLTDARHFGEDALDIGLSVDNKIGPQYDHLHRTIRSKLALFCDPNAADCQEFMHGVHHSLLHCRNATDSCAISLPDFDLRILALRSATWSVKNPARFVLDASTSYSRRSIEAVIDRVQTGISDVLRNKGCFIHIVAYKRGHLILDQTLHTSLAPPKPSLFPKAPVSDPADVIVARLKDRIHEDLNAVCKDTCSLDTIEEVTTDAHALEHTDRNASLRVPSPIMDTFKDTVIIDDPAVVEEEPIVPAPRVVELPYDASLDDDEVRSPSLASSAGFRRAFPLVPEKFTMPPSRSSSFGTTTLPPLCLEATVKDDTSVADVEECIDMSIGASPDAPVEAPIDGLVEAPAETRVDSSAKGSEETIVETAVDAPVDGQVEAELQPTEPTEVNTEPDREDTVATTEASVVDLSTGASDADSESNGESDLEYFSESDAVMDADSDMTPAVNAKDVAISASDNEHIWSLPVLEANDLLHLEEPEEQDAPEPAPARHVPSASHDFDENGCPQPVELSFERADSPTVGTPLETILESDNEPDQEVAFELPSYDYGLASETTEPKPDSFSTDSTPETIVEVASTTDEEEELFMSFSARHTAESERRDSFTGNTTLMTTSSSDLTRPSTPSLSLSSGDFNSPEISMLDTPNIRHESHTAMVTCFDSDGEDHFGGEYDAEHDVDSDSNAFGQYIGDSKPSNHQHPLAGHSLFGETLAVSFLPMQAGPSDADSASTESMCRDTTGTPVNAETIAHSPTPEQPTVETTTPMLHPTLLFEDFAMTKPTLDLDESIEVVDHVENNESLSSPLPASEYTVDEAVVYKQDSRELSEAHSQDDSGEALTLDGQELKIQGCSSVAPELVPLPATSENELQEYSESPDVPTQLDCPSVPAVLVLTEEKTHGKLLEDAESTAVLPSNPEPVCDSTFESAADSAVDLTMDCQSLLVAHAAEECLVDNEVTLVPTLNELPSTVQREIVAEPQDNAVESELVEPHAPASGENMQETTVVAEPQEATANATITSSSEKALTSALVPKMVHPHGALRLGESNAISLSSMTKISLLPALALNTPSLRGPIDMIGRIRANRPGPPKRAASFTLPAAGFLGLDETKRIQMGLRGALTGSHAFDNVLAHGRKHAHRHVPRLLLSQDNDRSSTHGESSSSSSKSSKAKRTHVRSAEHATAVAKPVEPEVVEQRVLPRVIMAFASMAVMSHMIDRSS